MIDILSREPIFVTHAESWRPILTSATDMRHISRQGFRLTFCSHWKPPASGTKLELSDGEQSTREPRFPDFGWGNAL